MKEKEIIKALLKHPIVLKQYEIFGFLDFICNEIGITEISVCEYEHDHVKNISDLSYNDDNFSKIRDALLIEKLSEEQEYYVEVTEYTEGSYNDDSYDDIVIDIIFNSDDLKARYKGISIESFLIIYADEYYKQVAAEYMNTYTDFQLTDECTDKSVDKQNNKVKSKKKGKNNIMKSILNEVKLGKIDRDDLKLSHLGVAVKNENDIYVSYDRNNKKIVNVDISSVNMKAGLFYFPSRITDIKENDVILHNNSVYYVTSAGEAGITAIDLKSGSETAVNITHDLFGIDMITKIATMMDMMGGNTNMNMDMNMMLPLMFLNKDDSDNKDDDMLKTLMIMQMFQQQGQVGSNNSFMNPMLMAAMMNSEENDNNMLMYMMAMNQMNQTQPNMMNFNMMNPNAMNQVPTEPVN